MQHQPVTSRIAGTDDLRPHTRTVFEVRWRHRTYSRDVKVKRFARLCDAQRWADRLGAEKGVTARVYVTSTAWVHVTGEVTR